MEYGTPVPYEHFVLDFAVQAGRVRRGAAGVSRDARGWIGEFSMTGAMPPVERKQLVLFETTLDDVIPEDHLVRFVDVILRDIHWSKFEQTYHGTLGARPVHPRVLASIIIYGQFTRVRSSR